MIVSWINAMTALVSTNSLIDFLNINIGKIMLIVDCHCIFLKMTSIQTRLFIDELPTN